jgi:hypothetical protein
MMNAGGSERHFERDLVRQRLLRGLYTDLVDIDQVRWVGGIENETFRAVETGLWVLLGDLKELFRIGGRVKGAESYGKGEGER